MRIPKYDVIHVFSAAYYSYLLSVMPALLIARLIGNTRFSTIRVGKLKIISNAGPGLQFRLCVSHEIIVPSRYLVGVSRFGLEARVIQTLSTGPL